MVQPADSVELTKLGGTLTAKRYRVDRSRAGVGAAEIDLDAQAKDDSIIEIEFEGGVKLWTSTARLRERADQRRNRSLRSLGDQIPLDDLFADGAERSGVTALVEAIRIFDADFDLAKFKEFVAGIPERLRAALGSPESIGETLGAAAAPWICLAFDYLRIEQPGLYRWTADGRLDDDPRPLGDGQEALVFLHGTASTTAGSFDHLRTEHGGKQWSKLTDRFGERMLTLEHWTLSESPIENAVALLGAETIPENARLHLLSHSRVRLGVYPGAIGDAEVVLSPDHPGRGAIIVGLGAFGSLDAQRLQRAVAAGLRRYGLAVVERDPTGADAPLEIGTLLIGASEAGVSIDESVGAVLRAIVETNALFSSAGPDRPGADRPLRYARLKIYEIWETIATQALDSVHRLAGAEPGDKTIDAGPTLVTGPGGRPCAPTAETEPDVRRLIVTKDARGQLNFLLPMARARVEELLVPSDRALVDHFVALAIRTRRDEIERFSPGVTLFELLVPNRLKPLAGRVSDLVLVLDDATAGYPWELMHDRSQGAEPHSSGRAPGW